MESFDFSTLPHNVSRVKIDIGLSYNVPQSEVWLNHDSDVFVFGFEPNPESVEIIQRGSIVPRPGHGAPLSDKNRGRFALMPVALGNVAEPTTLDFYMMGRDCGTSSLYHPDISCLGEIKRITKVPVHNLADFFKRFPWDRFSHIEYIKIDAQGSDLDILKGAGHYLADRVVYVTAEPENEQYFGCVNSSNDINKYMTSIGFERVNHPNTSDPTYLNPKFKHLADSIFIYQRG